MALLYPEKHNLLIDDNKQTYEVTLNLALS
jgi:hypothetical protein